MTLSLHDYQASAVREASAVLRSGGTRLFVSPTGSGKSYMQAALLAEMGPGHVQTVPNLDIARGLLEKMGVAVAGLNETNLRAAGEARGVYTTQRLYNLVLSASIPMPKTLSHDEAHHVDDTHAVIHAACGDCPRVGWTATAYRGTPEETKKLIADWGPPHVVLRLQDAVARSLIAKPTFDVWPLVNDDTIRVDKGEFVLSDVERAVRDATPALCDRVRGELCHCTGRPIRPTLVRAPGVRSAQELTEALKRADVPAVCVTGETGDRRSAFEAAVRCNAVLVQVRVVGEGVDLPMRVMVDVAPTFSPVLWMQAVGRITRPSPDQPRYIATNHNLCRHAYLWSGLIPAAEIRKAQLAWGTEYKPTRRSVARALGLEGFGRFVVAQAPLADGTAASLYALQTKDGLHLYAAVLHPLRGEPLYFEKTNELTGEKGTFLKNGHDIEYAVKRYGPWKRIAGIPDAEGYVSVRPSPLTEKQLDWWRRSAARFGLDPEATPDAREFQILPILSDCRISFKESA